MKYEIYTDGSCFGNPGPGGIGAVVYKDGVEIDTISQGYYKTTNNRMELLAVIEILKLKKYGEKDNVILWTDSNYVKRGVTEWIHGWKENNWMRNEGNRKKLLKNSDLWKQLDEIEKTNVEFKWIKGHSNEEGNETADALAQYASRRGPYKHDKGYV